MNTSAPARLSHGPEPTRGGPRPVAAAAVPGDGDALAATGCPLCRHPGGAETVYRFPPYAVARCRGCGFWFLNPRLDEAAMRASYEAADYFEGAGVGYASYVAQEATLRLTFQRFLGELARRGMTGGRLLEVGCAYGFFLEEAREFFRYRVGTDYSAAALEQAGGRADRFYLGGVEPVPADEPFDCAASIHVIEHVYEPVGFVRDLLARLQPGGWVVLATPDMGSFWRPLLGRRWPFFKVPEHVTYYDRRSLARLLREAGCDEVRPLPYRSVFSLELIGEKLGWRPPAALRGLRAWLPATTIAAAGRKPGS